MGGSVHEMLTHSIDSSASDGEKALDTRKLRVRWFVMRVAAIALLGVLLWPSFSFAEESDSSRPRIVVYSILFTRSLLEPIRERVLQRLYLGLENLDIDVIDHNEAVGALEMDGPSLTSTCVTGQCTRWILEACGADAGLRFRVEVVENSYNISLRLIGPGGNELQHLTRRCDICTFDEFEEAVAAVTGEIQPDVPRVVHPGRLDIIPSEARAQVLVDGVDLGAGELIVPLPPGLHVVEARLDGFEVARQEILVTASRTTRLELDLFASPLSAPEPRRGYRVEPWLWASFVVGVTATIAGGLLIGFDPGDHDPGEENEFLPWAGGTMGAGLAMTLISAISLAVLEAREP